MLEMIVGYGDLLTDAPVAVSYSHISEVIMQQESDQPNLTPEVRQAHLKSRCNICKAQPWYKILSSGEKICKSCLRKKAGQEPVTRAKNPGRNDPCLCGSGIKYKKCCLKAGFYVA